MAGTTSVRCYIDAYEGESGRQGPRLREKSTGRKVSFGEVAPERAEHFIQFLAAGFANAEVMPNVLEKDGEDDAVEVTGTVDFDSPEELRFHYDAQLSYLFV